MPLLEELLKPIAGEHPSGQDVRYTVYDKIQEARREEEALSSGVWTRELKKADFTLVIEVATDALLSQSKDLQVAAWLTEAWVVRDGIPGLENGLKLIHGLIENFWDTLYPQIEDGDLEMRVGPIQSVAERLENTVRKVALTKSKLDWFSFQEARQIGTEQDAKGDEAKKAVRQAAIGEGKCTWEQFDEAAKLSGAPFYQKLSAQLGSVRQVAKDLESLCDEKFGRIAPSFKNLFQAIDDLEDTVGYYYQPQHERPADSEPEVEQPSEIESTAETKPAHHSPKALARSSKEPVDREDALRRVFALCRYLQKQSPSDPVGYLILRALRWGELRSNISEIPAEVLDAPPSEVRQNLKKLSIEGQWEQVLENTENGFSFAWSRAWLDLQRHAVRASESMGYDSVTKAICSELRALLSDYPDLLNSSLLDDTPVASEETKEWVRSTILLRPTEGQSDSSSNGSPHPIDTPVSGGNSDGDVYETAQAMTKQGQVQAAVELLTREINQERSGRRRFTRKFQLASICQSAKYDAIAYPILIELSEEIEHRKLEEWEDPAMIANTLALLLRCLNRLGGSDAEKQRIYQKICRLDPLLALSLEKK